MKINYITFMVRDIESTIKFYTELAGLKIMNRLHPEMGEIAFLSNNDGETMLEFIQFENAEKVDIKGMVLSFKVTGSLEDLRKKAAESGYEPSVIVDKKPKPAHFTVTDPDGIIVEFTL